MNFRFGDNHKYTPPSNQELSEWGRKVFRLSAVILSPDREAAQLITIKALNIWKTLIDEEKQRAGKTKRYSSNPEKILFNRYHALQFRLLINLQNKEIEQEKELVNIKKEVIDKSFHPWTLILRYVKYVLKQTNKISESRLIGICRILRNYKFEEITAFFDQLTMPERHDVQYYKNNATRCFGNSIYNNEPEELRLHNRFAPFAEVIDLQNPTHAFNTVDSTHKVVEWIKERLSDELAPWGVEDSDSEQSNETEIHEKCQKAFDLIKNTSLESIKRPDQYCAIDELRMLILTNPQYFEHFFEQAIKSDLNLKKTQFQELQLPLMRYNNDEEMPQTPPSAPLDWQIHEELEAIRAYSFAIDTRQKGWRAEQLIVRANDKVVAHKNLFDNNDKKEFEVTLTSTELVDVYLKKDGEETFFYQLLIDFDELQEHQILERSFTAEGNQTISFVLKPKSHGKCSNNFQLNIKYQEPWHWKILRATQNWKQSKINFSTFATVGVGLGAVLLLGFIAGLFFFNRQQTTEPVVLNLDPTPNKITNVQQNPTPEFNTDDNSSEKQNTSRDFTIKELKDDEKSIKDFTIGNSDTEKLKRPSFEPKNEPDENLKPNKQLSPSTRQNRPVLELAQNAEVRSLTSGQKYKIKGIIVEKDNDGFIVRDNTGTDTKVVIAANTRIKQTDIMGGDKSPDSIIIRGLNVEIEGRGNDSGKLAATKIDYDDKDLRIAKENPLRITQTLNRLKQKEQNAKRISEQIDELMAISKAARGGAKAAKETAEEAENNAANQRISALDEYVVKSNANINFKANSAVLSFEAKQNLDKIAREAVTLRGYEIEITGIASEDGGTKALNIRRAQAIIDYLVDTHNIPIRRIGQSFGFSDLQTVRNKSVRESGKHKHEVEVKIRVSRGLNP